MSRRNLGSRLGAIGVANVRVQRRQAAGEVRRARDRRRGPWSPVFECRHDRLVLGDRALQALRRQHVEALVPRERLPHELDHLQQARIVTAGREAAMELVIGRDSRRRGPSAESRRRRLTARRSAIVSVSNGGVSRIATPSRISSDGMSSRSSPGSSRSAWRRCSAIASMPGSRGESTPTDSGKADVDQRSSLTYNRMVVGELTDEEVDRLFHALADATRRDILHRCVRGEPSVSRLADVYPMSFAAVQKHVAVLERAGLVTKERRGREQLVRTDPDAVGRARRVLDELETAWRGRVDRMADLLAQVPHERRRDTADERRQRREGLRQPEPHPGRRLRRPDRAGVAAVGRPAAAGALVGAADPPGDRGEARPGRRR